MDIQKYKAKIADTQTWVVGYIIEVREYLGNGTYGDGTEYLICVTRKSMPNGKYGTWKVDQKTITHFHDCPVCEIKEQNEKYNYVACS